MNQPPEGPGFLEKRFFNLFRDFPRFSRRFWKQLQGDGLLIFWYPWPGKRTPWAPGR